MRGFLVAAMVAIHCAIMAAAAHAARSVLGPTSLASGLSPWAPGCGGAGEALPSSVNYLNAEVETHVAVNPADANNVVAFWHELGAVAKPPALGTPLHKDIRRCRVSRPRLGTGARLSAQTGAKRTELAGIDLAQ